MPSQCRECMRLVPGPRRQAITRWPEKSIKFIVQSLWTRSWIRSFQVQFVWEMYWCLGPVFSLVNVVVCHLADWRDGRAQCFRSKRVCWYKYWWDFWRAWYEFPSASHHIWICYHVFKSAPVMSEWCWISNILTLPIILAKPGESDYDRSLLTSLRKEAYHCQFGDAPILALPPFWSSITWTCTSIFEMWFFSIAFEILGCVASAGLSLVSVMIRLSQICRNFEMIEVFAALLTLVTLAKRWIHSSCSVIKRWSTGADWSSCLHGWGSKGTVWVRYVILATSSFSAILTAYNMLTAMSGNPHTVISRCIHVQSLADVYISWKT